jgi:NADH dehydrogenase
MPASWPRAGRPAALGPLGRVTLYADRDYFVERIRLHQVAAGQVVRTIPLPRLLGRAGFEGGAGGGDRSRGARG